MNTTLTRPLAQLVRQKPSAPPPPEPPGCPDPVAALGGISLEAVSHVAELHFSARRARELHPNFLLFGGLETLWLNRNELAEIRGLLPGDGWRREHGLDKLAAKEQHLGTRRLIHLYLSDNRISSLAGDITRLKYLETLLLANNKLTNMEAVVTRLTALPNLRSLDLFGNPLAEEQNYRLYVVHHLPSVKIFDRHEVTQRERDAARALFSAAAQSVGRSAFGRSPDAHDPSLEGTPGADIPMSLNASPARHSVEVLFAGRRWRRIWHQVDGKRGAFDLRPALIAQLAQRATRVHIRTAGDASQSVTSNEGAWPIERLREGRCLSCMPSGRLPDEADVSKAWQGPAALLARLRCVPGASGESPDRPLTRVLYEAQGNEQGLHLVLPSTASAATECGWARGAPAPVEVYLDVDDAPPPPDAAGRESESVRQLGNKVRGIRREQQTREWLQRSAEDQRAAEGRTRRHAFHTEWTRRREQLLEKELIEVNKRREAAKQPPLSAADFREQVAARLDDMRDEREKARGAADRKRFLPSHKLRLGHQPNTEAAFDVGTVCESSEQVRTLPQRLCSGTVGEATATETARLLDELGMPGDLTAALSSISQWNHQKRVARVRNALGGRQGGAPSSESSAAEVAVSLGSATVDPAVFAKDLARLLDQPPQRLRVLHSEREDGGTCVSLRMPRLAADDLLRRARARAAGDPLFDDGAVVRIVAAREVQPVDGEVVSCLYSHRPRDGAQRRKFDATEALVPLRDEDTAAARYKELMDRAAPEARRRRCEQAVALFFDRSELATLESAFAVTDGSRPAASAGLTVGDRVLCRDQGAKEWRHGTVVAAEPQLQVRADGKSQVWDELAPIEVRRADAANLAELCMPEASRDLRAEVLSGLRPALSEGPSKLPDALSALCDQAAFVRYKHERMRNEAAEAMRASSFGDYSRVNALHDKINRAVDHLALVEHRAHGGRMGGAFEGSLGRRRVRGTVLWFDAARDTGAVRVDGAGGKGRQLCVGKSDIERGAQLRTGDKVSFIPDDERARALQVRPAAPAPARARAGAAGGGPAAAAAIPAAGINGLLGSVGQAAEKVMTKLQQKGKMRSQSEISSESD